MLVKEDNQPVLTSLELKNFRGFRELKMGPFKRLNLITGKNDTGKTSVLEALRILLAQRQTEDIRQLFNEFRSGTESDQSEHFWKWLIHDGRNDTEAELRLARDNGNPIELILCGKSLHGQIASERGLLHNGGASVIQIYTFGQPQNDKPRSQQFSNKPTDPKQDAIAYNRVIEQRGRQKVVSLMKRLNPRLEAIEPLQTDQQHGPIIRIDLGFKPLIPVTQMGQGFNRLLNIYSEVIAAEAKVLLIDEIENGLHYSVMPQVFEGLFNAVKELDIQIFATTHSWECIVAADDAARKCSSYDLNVIRLDRVGEDVTATAMDEKTLATARELQWEMR